MPLPAAIVGEDPGSSGSQNQAAVRKTGELITGPVEYSTSVYKELAANDTAYNFFTAQPGKQLVITGIFARADRQVSNANDADFIIYEATAPDTTTVSKVIFQDAMIQGDTVQMPGLSILISEGKYVNAKTTDDDFHVNIQGFFVRPVIDPEP